MRSKLIVWSSLALAVVVSGGAAAVGCGPSAAAACNAKCDCEGCGQVAFDQCVSEVSGDQQEADFRGCGMEYANYLACVDATGFCKGHDFETSCGPEKDAWKHCVDRKK